MIEWSRIDIDLLKDFNSDTIGWLRLDNTPINYPVVYERSDGYYLNHNYSGEESVHGCISYKEYGENNNRIILQGHAMKDETMFTYVQRYHYKDGFYQEHPYLILKTQEGYLTLAVSYAIDVMLGREYLGTIPEDPVKFDLWKEVIQSQNTIHGSPELKCDDRLFTLVTCHPFTTPEPDGTTFVFGTILTTAALSIE